MRGSPTEPTRAGGGRWLREPLLHFLLAGLALFIAYRLLHPETERPETSNRIRLTEGDLRQIRATRLAQGRPAPTPDEMKNLVEARVREEVFYREALALGLDRNDTIVKRRLAQKMEFLAEDLSTVADPAPAELKAWFERNAQRFATAPRVSFRHLYFSPDRRGAAAHDDAERVLETLRGAPARSAAAAGHADPFMFKSEYADSSLEQVVRVFGEKFAHALFGLKPGAWRGPIQSGYGWHLVWIDALQPSRIPAFEEVEPDVRREWIAQRRAEQERIAYQAMRARYEVVLPDSLVKLSALKGTRP